MGFFKVSKNSPASHLSSWTISGTCRVNPGICGPQMAPSKPWTLAFLGSAVVRTPILPQRMTSFIPAVLTFSFLAKSPLDLFSTRRARAQIFFLGIEGANLLATKALTLAGPPPISTFTSFLAYWSRASPWALKILALARSCSFLSTPSSRGMPSSRTATLASLKAIAGSDVCTASLSKGHAQSWISIAVPLRTS